MERAFKLRLLPLTLQSCLCLALRPIDPNPADPRAALPLWLGLVWGSWLHPRAALRGSQGLAWVGVGEGLPGPPHSPVLPVAPQCTAGVTPYSIRVLGSAGPNQGPWGMER